MKPSIEKRKVAADLRRAERSAKKQAEADEIVDQGMKAARRGEPESCNPYLKRKDDRYARLWAMGWRLAG